MQYASPFAMDCGPGGSGGAPTSTADDDPRRFAMTQKALGLGHCCALCAPFMQIEPLIRTDKGTRINPLFDAVKQFRVAANPFPLMLAPGQTQDMTLVVQAEENHMGDLLISEMLAQTLPLPAAPGAPGARFAIAFTNMQNDRFFSNAPVLDRFCFSNSQLTNTWPCCFLIQATNFLQITVTNIGTLPGSIGVVARGQRFLPYMYPHLREQMLSYWNTNRTVPYFLTIDKVMEGGGITALSAGGVRIPPGATATVFMTVPGAGDFEAKELLCDVQGVSAPVDSSEINAIISEGVGRAIQDQPMGLGTFLAQPNMEIGPGSTGFQGGVFRAASGGHARQFSQAFKRNTRMKIVMTNTNMASSADVRLAYRGCCHYYDDCEPGDGLQRLLSLEPSVGPMLIPSPPCPPLAQFAPQQYQGMQPQNGGYYAPVPPTGRAFPPAAFRGGPSASPYFPPSAYANPRIRALEPADGGSPQGSWGRW